MNRELIMKQDRVTSRRRLGNDLCQDYLVWRWNNMGNPKLGPTPSGTGAIAKMRLVRAPGHGQKCLVWYFRKGPLERNQYNQYIVGAIRFEVV